MIPPLPVKRLRLVSFAITSLVLAALPLSAEAADRYWVGADAGATAVWNDANNWSATSGGAGGAGVPGAGDDVIFDGGGSKVGGVVIDADVSIASLTATAGYTGANANDGHFDDTTNDHNITVSGSVTLDNKQVSMGNGTWTVSGDFDNKDVSSFNENGSTLVMDGASATLLSDNSSDLNHLTISGNVTLSSASGDADVRGILRVSGTLVVNDRLFVRNSGDANDVQVEESGLITGSDELTAQSISQMDGTINVDSLELQSFAGDISIVPAQYDAATVTIRGPHSSNDRSVGFTGTGDITITNDLVVLSERAGQTLTVDNSTYNNSWIVQGDVTFQEVAGTLAWTKGTGSILLSGTANQSVNFLAKAVEDLIVNKTGGTVTFTDGFTSDSFDLQDGTVDFNGQSITSSGALTIGSNGDVDASGLVGSALTVNGDFTATGSDGDLLTLNASAEWTLTVNGVGSGSYITVANSDASGGSEIICATGCTLGAGNQNWATTDTTDPTIDSLSPADDATGVAVDSTLTITFSEAVTPQSGTENDIVIKQSSDDSTVETIDAQSGQVSGGGTRTITVTPSSDFASLTGYYIQIGANAFDDEYGNNQLLPAEPVV